MIYEVILVQRSAASVLWSYRENSLWLGPTDIDLGREPLEPCAERFIFVKPSSLVHILSHLRHWYYIPLPASLDTVVRSDNLTANRENPRLAVHEGEQARVHEVENLPIRTWVPVLLLIGNVFK